MHVSTETTISDLESLSPEGYHRALAAEAADLAHSMRKIENVITPRTVPVVRSKRRRAGKSPMVATRRPRLARQVLVPGKRKAARHLWADRLEAARTGGFSVGQVFTDTDRVVACCYACDTRFHLSLGDASAADRSGFEAECRRHEARECVDGVVL